MTIQEMIDFLSTKCVDRNKEILIRDYEWGRNIPIDFLDVDSDDGNLVLY